MNISIYSRKSIYSDKSDSTESQFLMCKDYAEKHFTGYNTFTRYEDEGFTGANTNRPQFKKLMDDIKNGYVDVLICYKIDRISRNVKDFSTTFDFLQKHNVNFVSIKEQIDTSTPLGRAMMYICSVFAQMERETIAERVKDNMIELSKKGYWTGGRPPIGYKIEKIKFNGKNHSILAIDDESAPLYHKIIESLSSGYSCIWTEKTLYSQGYRSREGNRIYDSNIHFISKTPYHVAADSYIYDYFHSQGCIIANEKEEFTGEYGTMIYSRHNGEDNTTIVSIGKHKPLISSKDWLNIQKNMKGNIWVKERKHEIGILCGIVRCKCGRFLAVRNDLKVAQKGEHRYQAYYCPNRSRRGMEVCDLPTTTVEALDSIVIEKLKDLSMSKDGIYDYVKQRNVKPTQSKDTIIKAIKQLESKIKKLAESISSCPESSAAKYIIQQIEELDKEIVGLNFELREIEIYEKESSVIEDSVDYLYDKMRYIIQNLDSMPYDILNKSLKDLIKSCVYDGENLDLTL